ncbi:hypothetical protein [Alcanivorax sp.]|uniref:hypothetical protein n=1 Tax=Alcanivorax sp. TaxID=1872427 RepID=UPI003A8E7C2A
MIIISAAILFYAIFKLRNSSGFDGVFVSAALFFVFVFYLYPLWVIERDGGYSIRTWNEVGESEIYYCLIGLLVFVLGFSVSGPFMKSRVEIDSRGGEDRVLRTKLFFPIFAVVVAFYFWELLDPSRAASAYAARRGELQVGRGAFLLSIVAALMKFYILLILIESRKKIVFWWVWGLFIVAALTTATGRMSLLILFMVAAVYIFFKRPAKIYIFAVFLFPFLVPILVNMKSIIYEVAYLNVVPDFHKYYFSPLTSATVVNNFGHPVYSFIERESLVDLVGYRFFYDFIHGFLFYLRVFGVGVGDSLIYFNTEAIIGRRESIIPTGYLAFGYVQLSYLGIFFSGVFYRALGFFVGRMLKFSRLRSPVAIYYFATMSAFSFYHGEVRVIVMTLIFPVVLVSIISRCSFSVR